MLKSDSKYYEFKNAKNKNNEKYKKYARREGVWRGTRAPTTNDLVSTATQSETDGENQHTGNLKKHCGERVTWPSRTETARHRPAKTNQN